MKAKLKEILPEHKLSTSSSSELYIVDYKNLNNGDVELLEIKPEGIKSIYLENPRSVEIIFDGFKDNSLPLDEPGEYCRQCECVIFPKSCNENDWILFIEAKYTNNLESAFKKENDYPNCMKEQVLLTVEYFRNKGIIAKDRRVNAIVSFPNLISEFNSTFFSNRKEIEDILLKHKILIRATNSALIKSEKRIKLNSI